MKETSSASYIKNNISGTSFNGASGVSSAAGYPDMTVVPDDFKYKSAYLKGRPRHEKYSGFMCRHPSMSCSRRAKLFMPFDALKGFDDALRSAEKDASSS